jgi:probable O-glycosylation ligase (exosortase A-associated)
MNPHRLTWGFAYDWPFAHIVALATLAGLLLTRAAKWPQPNVLFTAWLLFVLWTGVTTANALHPEPALVRWTDLMKTSLVVLLITLLFHTKKELRLLIWVIALSIAFYGVKGGIFTVLSGGDNRVYGPPNSLIGDNTSIGVAIIMVIPLLYYLYVTTVSKWVRWLLVCTMLLCGLGVLGTYSRGAFVAACAIGVFLWWNSRHKIGILLALLIATPFGLAVMPEKWHERMDTIVDYEQDNSANMRLNSWMTMLNLAKDRPLTGGGFDAGSREVYDRYAPDPTKPPHTAHSIYFQALGEHGFVGLALYVWIFLAAWAQCGAWMRAARSRPELAWAGELGRMMQVTLVGYAVGGLFLSLVNLDVPYYLVAAVLVTTALVRRELGTQAAAASPATIGAGGHGVRS